MRYIAALVFLTASLAATGANHPFRIAIHHADPYAVKAMLEGKQILCPEVSLFLLAGGPNMVTGGGAPLFTGGHLIVNPTDNSIWFIPDRTQ